MLVLFLQLILAIDAAALIWLLFLAGERHISGAFRDREMKLLMGFSQGIVVINQNREIIAMNQPAISLFPDVREPDASFIERLALFDQTGSIIRAKEHPFQLALHRRRSTPQSRMWVKRNEELIPVSISVAFVPSSNDVSSAVVGLVEDVSKEELIERIKSNFIGIASHQLRSPLASLKWYGEIFTKDVGSALPVKDREYLRRMNDATARMIDLVDDFLEASRLETTLEPQHVDKIILKDLIKHILETQIPFIKAKNISIRLSQDGNVKTAYADPAMLREVLANFVANAVKYNRRKGKLSIRIRQIGQNVEVEVRDTGVGIPQDQQDQVFTKFFRADNAVTQGFKGTGLGMYTAKMLLEQMDGNVRFESTQGKGTTFWVTFPSDQRK